jgi:choline dehydrogenase-like flavoprotein
MQTRRFDAIVVGAGMTGGMAAKELAEAGLAVLVLEAGRDTARAAWYAVEAMKRHEL